VYSRNMQRRPAGAARGTTVQLSSLESLATAATTTWTERTGVAVHCYFKGQQYGPRGRQRYRLEPSTWRLRQNSRLSQQMVAWGWRVGATDQPEHVVVQQCHNAYSRGLRAPDAVKTLETSVASRNVDVRLLRKSLVKAAVDAQIAEGDSMLEEFGQRLRCSYESGHPAQWQLPAGTRVGRAEVVFKWSFPDGTGETVTVQVRNALGKPVPLPLRLRNDSRHARCHRLATAIAQRTGCPCKCTAPADLIIHYSTPVPFVWEHVQTAEDTEHFAEISYLHLAVHGRSVPRCPLYLRGSRGFRYGLAFLDAFASLRHVGFSYAGILYDGPVPQMARDVPESGVDILDCKVYWQFPNGTLRCLSVKEVHALSEEDLLQPQSLEEYSHVAESLGYQYLGGGCDVTALLEDPGTLGDQRWGACPWTLPETSLSACWWLTNPADDPTASPKMLCRSLLLLRAELHQTRVATLSEIVEERARRGEANAMLRVRLGANPQWSMLAEARQCSSILHPNLAQLANVRREWDVLSAAPDPDATTEPQQASQDRAFVIAEVSELLGAIVTQDEEEIRRQRFSSTPSGLYDEMLRAILAR